MSFTLKKKIGQEYTLNSVGRPQRREMVCYKKKTLKTHFRVEGRYVSLFSLEEEDLCTDYRKNKKSQR